uniref:Tubby-like protein n=3 Tax=Meloidogyne enterolobii TaxID=390850 RepID=A0A6V7WB61_MELEN|nr:unnamed protein product [Meloidogyne enterolobii]
MSASDRWVNHNLQRQRELLEKQRQRRLQANLTSTVFKTNENGQNENQNFQINNSKDVFNSKTQLNSTFTTTPSTSQNINNIGGRQIHSSGSLYSFAGNENTIISSSATSTNQQLINNNNSSNQNFKSNNSILNKQQQQYSSTSTSTSSFSSTPTPTSIIGDAKIITVKGFTPPQSRKSSDENNKNNSLRKPILNVEHLEPVSYVSSFSSEVDEDDGGFRGLNIQKSVSGRSSAQQSHSSTTALASKRPSWNDDGEDEVDDDEGSIPTEILNDEPLEMLDVNENLEQFVMEPIRKNCTLKCRISRDKRGVDKGMFPTYYLHLEKNDGRRTFLLAARRRKKATTANYLISIDPTDLRRNGQSFMAKVRSNAMGTMFTIYDNGENPKKPSAVGESIRRELAAVIYEKNVLGLKGPRKMTIIMPGIYIDPKHNYLRPLAVRPISERDSILERYRTNRLDEMVVLNNKQPVWNEESQSYVLNFHGRVTQASVKNFQIVHSMHASQSEMNHQNNNNIQVIPDPSEYVIMQFGRLDNETFTMDVRYPLTPVQAFGIAMTSFHGKLACE